MNGLSYPFHVQNHVQVDGMFICFSSFWWKKNRMTETVPKSFDWAVLCWFCVFDFCVCVCIFFGVKSLFYVLLGLFV